MSCSFSTHSAISDPSFNISVQLDTRKVARMALEIKSTERLCIQRALSVNSRGSVVLYAVLFFNNDGVDKLATVFIPIRIRLTSKFWP